MVEQKTNPNGVEILEVNRGAIQETKNNKKKKVKDGKRGFFAITKYNFIAGIAYIVQVVMDKAGIFGKILGAGLGQIATNHYDALCSAVSRYVVDNKLYENPAFTQIFGGNTTFYQEQLQNFNNFMSKVNPTPTDFMQGGIAVEGVIQQSTLMNIIGTVIQFVIQNPFIIILPTAALCYELIRRVIRKIKDHRDFKREYLEESRQEALLEPENQSRRTR